MATLLKTRGVTVAITLRSVPRKRMLQGDRKTTGGRAGDVAQARLTLPDGVPRRRPPMCTVGSDGGLEAQAAAARLAHPYAAGLSLRSAEQRRFESLPLVGSSSAACPWSTSRYSPIRIRLRISLGSGIITWLIAIR